MLGVSDLHVDARVRKQAAALTRSGAQVTIVWVGPSAPEDLVAAGYDVRIIERFRVPRLGEADIWWPLRVAVNLTYTKAREKWYLRKASSLATLNGPALLDAAIAARPDVIHAHNIHTIAVGTRAKRISGARVVYDCRDLFADVEYYDEETRERLRSAEAASIHEVDQTIVVSEVFADILSSRYGIPRPTVIYNGPDQVVPTPRPVHEPVRLFFQGAYRRNRNLGSLIEAMCILEGRATLTLQGFGRVEEELRDMVARLSLSDVVTFVPPAAPLDVVRSAAEYDVGVICYRGDSLNLESTVPNKLMDYLGAGLALAVSDLPGHRSVLEGTGAGIFIDPSDAGSIARDLARLIDDPERITGMKRAALETARRHEWSVQAGRLVRVYEGVLNREAV
ncbi:glycosyltransferase [Anaerosoma tenue]|uniref:glycosyltransferase n=1 Tax=Anaerosoma tenue TaxID=2933588 RepID=UPI002260D0AC|nr:glycosyltransferase [Anaerosoma tenue]MCK8114693.1 glycosyltransferase [Anaerosoma tenue]